jgi:transposase
MAKYQNVKIGSYRTRDGKKIKAHTRRVKVSRGTISRIKELKNHFKGKLHSARRSGASKKVTDRLKSRVRELSRNVNSLKLGERKYRQGKIYQKRHKGKR